MSDHNKATVRRFYDEVFNRGDVNAIDQFCAPDFKDHTAMPGQAPGVQGLKQIMGAYFNAFPDMKIEVEDIIAEGDLVAARFSGSATHKGDLFGTAATGKRIHFSGTDFLRFKNGKVTDVWHQGDDVIALMQIGIKPPGM
jgi:steroid delta-isomerase-like uncharacterized protein